MKEILGYFVNLLIFLSILGEISTFSGTILQMLWRYGGNFEILRDF